jgi:hypothetical protein
MNSYCFPRWLLPHGCHRGTSRTVEPLVPPMRGHCSVAAFRTWTRFGRGCRAVAVASDARPHVTCAPLAFADTEAVVGVVAASSFLVRAKRSLRLERRHLRTVDSTTGLICGQTRDAHRILLAARVSRATSGSGSAIGKSASGSSSSSTTSHCLRRPSAGSTASTGTSTRSSSGTGGTCGSRRSSARARTR